MEKKPGNEVATLVLDQVMAFEPMLAASSDGQYLIPGISMADYGDSRLHLATHLTFILARTYPEFQFWKSEKLFDNDGLTIHWRRIPLAVEVATSPKPLPQTDQEYFLEEFTHDPQWKEIAGFPGYWISDVGTVFSMKKAKKLKPVRRLSGKLMVRMYRDHKVVWRVIEKLREAAFGDQEDY